MNVGKGFGLGFVVFLLGILIILPMFYGVGTYHPNRAVEEWARDYGIGEKRLGISLDGTGDFVVVNDADSLDINGSFTLECWFYSRSHNDYDRVINKAVGTGTYTSYALMWDENGKFKVRFYDDEGTQKYAVSGEALNEGQWYHIVGIFDDDLNTLTLYVNATLQITSSSITVNPVLTDGILCIGAIDIDGVASVDAIIDEVRIYNRALSVDEVEWSYNSGAGKEPYNTYGLVLWIRFDEYSWDRTDYHNDGTLYGDAKYSAGIEYGTPDLNILGQFAFAIVVLLSLTSMFVVFLKWE